MKLTRRFGIVTVFLAMFLAAAGCSNNDGGVTDPLPDVTPKGDLQVRPDSLGTMDPLIQAVAKAQPGFVIVVFPGIYDGNLVVDKPLHFVSSAGKENTILQNSADSTAMNVRLPGSYGPADSLIFEGLGFNNSRWGVAVESSTIPVVFRRCDVLDNAGTGLQIGGFTDKAPGDPAVVLWQCFFRRNGLDPAEGTRTAAAAAIWCTGTLSAESIFFESNAIDIALTDGGNGSVVRMSSGESVLSSLWLESGSDLKLDGVSEDIPTQLRQGLGWAAIVDGSRLHVVQFSVNRFEEGGFKIAGGTLVLDDVLLDANRRYSIFSVDSVDSLTNTTITGTVASRDVNELGYGMAASSTGDPVTAYLEKCSVSGSYRGGITATGPVRMELHECEVSENGVFWAEQYDPETDEEPVTGGGVGLFAGATASLDELSTIRFNSALVGGGLAIVGSACSATLSGSKVEKNSSKEMGGGIAIVSGGVVVSNGVIEGNSSKEFGGGISITEGGSFDISGDGVISGNSAEGRGGGVYILDGHAGFLGGIRFMGNDAKNDRKDGVGGAIYGDEADLVLQSAQFEGNLGDAAAALYVANLKEDVAVTDCVFQQNVTGKATIFARDLTRDLRLERCLIVGNKLNSPTAMEATAILSRQDLPGGTLSIVGCTIAKNEGGTGAIHHYSGNMNLTESVIAFNRPGGMMGTDLGFVTMDCDDFWDNGDFDFGEGGDPGPNSFAADPLFCDLENGVYTVDGASPLLPANNSCNVQIGALGQGCGQGN